ncbi:MAG: type II toxin-antitoxin system VapC family toxin [Patescibacteria group bacterium]
MHRGYVADASVVVQLLNAFGETAVEQSRELLRGAVMREYPIIVPDLLWYEVTNALVRGKGLKSTNLQDALDLLFSFPLTFVWATKERVASASLIASVYSLSVYDALYAALALEYNIPLLTANMKHQGKVSGLHAVDIQNWYGILRK